MRIADIVPAALAEILPEWIPANEIATYDKRDWGGWVMLKAGFKVLVCTAGWRLSLQRHRWRHEIWQIHSGNPIVTINDRLITLNPREAAVIRIGDKHRLQATTRNVIWFEFYPWDSYYDETDLERLEDDYGRVGQTPGSVSVK